MLKKFVFFIHDKREIVFRQFNIIEILLIFLQKMHLLKMFTVQPKRTSNWCGWLLPTIILLDYCMSNKIIYFSVFAVFPRIFNFDKIQRKQRRYLIKSISNQKKIPWWCEVDFVDSLFRIFNRFCVQKDKSIQKS